MKRRNCLIIAAAALLLAGCADVPSNVREEMSILDQAVHSEPDSEATSEVSTPEKSLLKKGKLPELSAQAEQELAANRTRIVIESVRIPDADSMPVCDVKMAGAPIDNFYEICAELFPDDDTGRESPYYTLKRGDEASDKDLPAYDHSWLDGEGHLKNPNVFFLDTANFFPRSDLPNYGLMYRSSGNLFGTQTGATEYYDYMQYIPLSSDPPEVQAQKSDPIVCSRAEAVAGNDSYPMVGGGEWALKDAVGYVEKLYNSVLRKADGAPLLTYSVKEIQVLTVVPEKQYAYFFFVECADAEGRYLDCTMKNPNKKWIKKLIEGNQPFPMDYCSAVFCYQKDQFAWMQKNESFSEIKPSAEDPELLSVTEAARVIDELLAPSQLIRIPCAELNYVLVCKGYPYAQLWQQEYGYESDPDSPYADFNEMLCDKSCEFALRPVWCFRTESYSEFNRNVGYRYLVDAVTGKLWITRITNTMDAREQVYVQRIMDYINGEDIE